MVRSWRLGPQWVLMAVAWVGTACSPTPTGMPDYSCTPSIGLLPFFEFTNETAVFMTGRPAPGGASQVRVEIASVGAGAFDFVIWDVLDLIGYAQPPDSMTYMVEQNPTNGTATTSALITVYAETPPGEYGLKLRGLAHTGSFIEGSPVVVGECFRPFVLRVN